jgi:hypothetical protein
MKPHSIAAVFDRTEIETLRKMAGELEADAPKPHDAGWSKGLTFFEGFEDMRYLIYVAESPDRIVSCAPRFMLAADETALRESLTEADSILAGRTAKWWIKGTEDTCGLVRGILKGLTQTSSGGLH